MTLENDDSDNDSFDCNDPYLKMIQFQSIRNKGGLEEAISVQWHEYASKTLRISTLLEPKDLAPLFDGAGWAGTRVWHAAIAAIHYLVDKQSLVSSTSTILELGCGLGVPGMMLHSIYDCQVCLTDQESILSQLQSNVERNFPDDENIVARPLSWSKQGIQEILARQENDFDIVLNCDCIYEPLYGESWKLLVECIDEMLRINPKTMVVTSVERRAADGIDLFLKALGECANVSTVDKAWEDNDYRIEIYVAKGNAAE